MKPHALWCLAFALTTILSCRKNDDNEKSDVVSRDGIILSGANVTSPVTTMGTGTMNVAYNKTTKKLSLKVNWSSLSSTPNGAHIHGTAPKGGDADMVVQFLIDAMPAGGFESFIPLQDIHLNEDSLLLGYYYFDIHTENFPAGEIRGQIEF